MIVDLKGQIVVFKCGSLVYYVMIKFLCMVGLMLDDIKLQDLVLFDVIVVFDVGVIGVWMIWDFYFVVVQECFNICVLLMIEQLELEFNFYLVNGNYVKDNFELIVMLVDMVKVVGQQGQVDLFIIIVILFKVIGLLESVMQWFLICKGSDLGLVGFIELKYIVYEQGVVDEFFKLKIIFWQLDIVLVVWML